MLIVACVCVQGNLFIPVVEALVANYDRYNLLNSAILELFEFIKAGALFPMHCPRVSNPDPHSFELLDPDLDRGVQIALKF
jgi:hypothetical protein